MKKIFTLATCLLILTACAQRSQKVPENDSKGTVITWI